MVSSDILGPQCMQCLIPYMETVTNLAAYFAQSLPRVHALCFLMKEFNLPFLTFLTNLYFHPAECLEPLAPLFFLFVARFAF